MSTHSYELWESKPSIHTKERLKPKPAALVVLQEEGIFPTLPPAGVKKAFLSQEEPPSSKAAQYDTPSQIVLHFIHSSPLSV